MPTDPQGPADARALVEIEALDELNGPHWYVGQRVWMSDEAVERAMLGRATSRFGTVRRIGHRYRGVILISVQRDGIGHADAYPPGFWIPAPAVGRVNVAPTEAEA